MTEEKRRLVFHTLDYRKDRGEKGWINIGFWLLNTPRLVPACRLLGHKPVVDGVTFSDSINSASRRSRWACCDRCGIRLKQPIDADLEIGQSYTDPLPTPPSPRGTIGGQLVIGPSHSGLSAQVKVGNAGSEHTLACHLRVHPVGALYLHAEGHGRGLQRRLNPTGYHSRVIELAADGGHLRWRLWAKRDEHNRDDPWWMHGSIQIDPRTLLWGPKRYTYADVGEPVTTTVRMPHGDDYPATLQLQRQELGRARGRKREQSWTVQWDVPGGIPTKNSDRGRVSGSAEPVSDADVQHGGWAEMASAAIAARMTRDRVRYGFRPVAA